MARFNPVPRSLALPSVKQGCLYLEKHISFVEFEDIMQSMSYLAACPFLNKAPFSVLKGAGKSLDAVASRCPAMRRVFHAGSNMPPTISIGIPKTFVCVWVCVREAFGRHLSFSFHIYFKIFIIYFAISSAGRVFENAHRAISTPTGKCPFRDAMQKQGMCTKPTAVSGGGGGGGVDPQPTAANGATNGEQRECKCYIEGLQPQGG